MKSHLNTKQVIFYLAIDKSLMTIVILGYFGNTLLNNLFI